MADFTFPYETKEERQRIIAEQEAEGRRMRHDNRLEDGTLELVFTDDAEQRPPDMGGFRLAALGTLGRRRVRVLLRDYPDFNIALEAARWPLALVALEDALADGALTREENDTLIGLWDAHNLPREGG
jgi:hypothetical protein